MGKNNNRSKRGSKKRQPKQNAEGNVVRPLRRVTQVPSGSNPVFKVMRATQRVFAINSAVGIDGYPYFDMELTFCPSATRYYIQGASIYGDSLPNVTEFSSLFDSWRVKKVVVRMDFPMGYSNSGYNPGLILPQVVYVPDYNDAGTVSKSDLLQYPQVQVHNFNKDGYTPLMFELSPQALQEVSSGIVSTGYANLPLGTWLRTSNMDVQHYGVKMYFDFFNQAANLSFPFEFTIWYELEFTNPK